MVILQATLMSVAYANPIINASNSIENSASVHEWAHFGIGYVMTDLLRKHTKMTPLERVATVAFAGYAKERWIDKEFNKREFLATAIGSIVCEF